MQLAVTVFVLAEVAFYYTSLLIVVTKVGIISGGGWPRMVGNSNCIAHNYAHWWVSLHYLLTTCVYELVVNVVRDNIDTLFQ